MSRETDNETRWSAACTAHPNIALVKYWGKRDGALNLPAVGSISITLQTLFTHTHVTFIEGTDSGREPDRFVLNGVVAAKHAARASAFLDLIRRRKGVRWRAEVDTRNNFPTGAGLASSASGFAALALAASRALELDLEARVLSALARQGSGSAARSIFGGFVEMHHGERADGEDCVATPLLAAEAWPLTVLVAVTSEAEKAIGSTDGMERTRHTSPYYDAWMSGQNADLAEAREAIARRDFDALASISEHSCLKMHALALAARPPLLYWNSVTVAAIDAVWRLRRGGVPVFLTIDAGPQVKAICLPTAAPQVLQALSGVPGVQRVLTSGLGPGAHIVTGTAP